MEVACSAIAGICARVLCHPLDTIKTVAFTGFAGEYHVASAVQTSIPAAAASATSDSVATATTLPATAAIPNGIPRSSFASSANSIWTREGIAGFYRGVGVAAVGSAPGVALYLTTYDRCSASWKVFGDAEPTADVATNGNCNATFIEMLRSIAGGTPASVRFFVCGLVAETVSCLVWVPIDVAKERLQSQPPTLQARYTNSFEALQRILSNEGLRGLYKGYFSTLGSFGPFSAVYFVFYEYFTSILKTLHASSFLSKKYNRGNARSGADAGELSSRAKFTIALAAGAGGNVVASLCTNPLELVKTRLQVQRAVLYRDAVVGVPMHPKLYAYHYDGLRDGLAQMAKTEGVRALWRGVGSRIAYTAPNAALTMGFFELLKLKLM